MCRRWLSAYRADIGCARENASGSAVAHQVTLKTDSMDLAADVIQALCSFLKIEDLQTSVDFPEDLEELLLILNKVMTVTDDCDSVTVMTVNGCWPMPGGLNFQF